MQSFQRKPEWSDSSRYLTFLTLGVPVLLSAKMMQGDKGL